MDKEEIDAFVRLSKTYEGNFLRISRSNNGTIVIRYQGRLKNDSLYGIDVSTGQLTVIQCRVITTISKIPDEMALLYLGNKANYTTTTLADKNTSTNH